ncbi:MAG: homoserine dehydrogenase [Candidatus Geothermincolia bacterium]
MEKSGKEAMPVKVGLLGCGTVGSGVYSILAGSRDLIGKRTGCDIYVERIAVRDFDDPRFTEVDESLLTTRVEDVLDDPEISIVAEVIGGIEPARTFIMRAIQQGKHIVTANKALMSTYGGEILDAAEAAGVDVLYEASVGGAIPIIHPLKEVLAGNRISRILGVVNGTTNYILTRMSEGGIPFEEALREAQALGYAEADPESDVEGLDAAAKIAIMASAAFNSRVTLGDVYTEGISRISVDDIAFARELGYAIKLLAIASDDASGISVRVHPTMIPLRHPLASVNDVFNAIFVEADAAGELMFYGRGAGMLPAGSSVVGDIIAIARNQAHGGRAVGCTCFVQKRLKSMSETVCRYYVLLDAEDQPGVLARIASVFGNNQVSIKSVIQHGGGTHARIMLVTHQVNEERMMAAVRGLEETAAVNRIANVIRVEDEGD